MYLSNITHSPEPNPKAQTPTSALVQIVLTVWSFCWFPCGATTAAAPRRVQTETAPRVPRTGPPRLNVLFRSERKQTFTFVSKQNLLFAAFVSTMKCYSSVLAIFRKRASTLTLALACRVDTTMEVAESSNQNKRSKSLKQRRNNRNQPSAAADRLS